VSQSTIVSTHRRVAITGLGLVSPHGADATSAFRSWCEGNSCIQSHLIGEAPYSIQIPYAMCEGFKPEAVLSRPRMVAMDRVSQLSCVAGLAAWQDAGLDEASATDREGYDIHWGTGAGGSQTTERSYRELLHKGRNRISPLTVVTGMHNSSVAHLSLLLALGGECLTYSVACASSAVAIGEAFRRVRTGQTPVALAGGAEAAMPFGVAKAWESMQVLATPGETVEQACRPFDQKRTGLVLGEGAAALVLEDWDHALSRGATIHAEMIGYGNSTDHFHLTTPAATGQIRALHRALSDARISPADVNHVNAHGTATKEGDAIEAESLRAVFGPSAEQLRICSTKSMHGHLLGGAGALEAVVTIQSLKHQLVPPTLNLEQADLACQGLPFAGHGKAVAHPMQVALSNSFAFGGSNAVLAFRRAG